ncbi:hypothetical protein K503DRAFT_133514 [Rhizopogon vinicolor AM-OR11-026]|uniref:DUF6533 domain-containing protein n=1 Tax=Rhizopogon vinicolor AM-OR11-026 TaxID=1314800 RepID=A0A1B7N1V9_9AGAM|nr:hypothetical protein K503DRAFT_133514 [Rhizopogon vinicolor AM-OR11-026]
MTGSSIRDKVYSADDIASARSLQTFTYIYTSMAAFWTYDYVCSIHEEWTFQLRSRWTKVKGLYIVTRYTPFLLFASYLYMNFLTVTGFSVISLVCAESFFILRTYVLWNKSRIVLAVILITSLVSPMRLLRHKLLVDASVRLSPQHQSSLPFPLRPLLHRDPRHYRLLPELRQLRPLHTLSSLVCARAGTPRSHAHSCHTVLADDQKFSVRCLAKA